MGLPEIDSPQLYALMVHHPFPYPLVNVHIVTERSHHFSWENLLFLWPFSIANF